MDEKIYLVVDVAQAVFTFDIMPEELTDIYLGTSSKALGAEPSIGFAFLNIDKKLNDSIISSNEALNSFLERIKNFDEKKTFLQYPKIKKEVKTQLDLIGLKEITTNSSPFFISIENTRAEEIKRFLKKEDIIVANSTDSRYTLTKFKSILRISWRDDVTEKDLSKLYLALSKFLMLKKISSKNIRKKILEKEGVLFIDAGKIGGSVYGYSKPLAISILQTIAEKNNIKSTYIPLENIKGHNNSQKAQSLKKIINEFGILAITSTSPGHGNIINLLDKLKEISEFKELIIIKGGIHETESAELLQKNPNYPIDISFIGEADISFDSFLKVLKNKKEMSLTTSEKNIQRIEGIYYKDKLTKFKRDFVNSNKFILPYFKYLQIEKPYALLRGSEKNSMIRIMSMRGCAFGCNFCAISKNCRRINPKKLIDYLKYLIKESEKINNPIKQLFFEDATFTIDQKLNLINQNHWSEKFAKLLKKNKLNISFGIQTRIDCLNEEIIKKLSEVGLKSVYLGVESLNNTQLSLFNKGFSLGKELDYLMNLIRTLKKHNIGISVSLIAIPQKNRLLIETLKFLIHLEIEEIFIEMYKIYPGTANSMRIKNEILDKYNKGINSVHSPNPEDLNSFISDAEKKEKTSYNSIYREIQNTIKNSIYEEINPGHYGIKEKMRDKDFLSFSKHNLTTNPK